MRRLIASKEVTWPCLYWTPSQPPPAVEWGVRDWPANFVIDRNGIVQAVNMFDEDDLTNIIEGLISD